MLNRILLLACLLVIPAAQADVPETLKQDAIWYGVAYYDEYMPYYRLMKKSVKFCPECAYNCSEQ